MKLLLAVILIGLSIPVGLLAAANIFYIFKTMGSSQIPAPTTAKYAITGALALFAILLFFGGISTIGTKEKS